MDQAAENMLMAFASACARPTIQDSDWEQLYRFTLYIHQRGFNTEHGTIRDHLIKRGCSIQKASWLSAQYRHFATLLSLYDQAQRS